MQNVGEGKISDTESLRARNQTEYPWFRTAIVLKKVKQDKVA